MGIMLRKNVTFAALRNSHPCFGQIYGHANVLLARKSDILSPLYNHVNLVEKNSRDLNKRFFF